MQLLFPIGLAILCVSALFGCTRADPEPWGGSYYGGSSRHFGLGGHGHNRGHFSGYSGGHGHNRGHFRGYSGGRARGHYGGYFGGHSLGHFGNYGNRGYGSRSFGYGK